MPMHPELPRQLYSAAATRELDARIIAAGTPGFELMRRAAVAVWRELRSRWPQARQLTVLCGGGNNAGDGYLIAQLAHLDRKSTRLNSSHVKISYAVFCLKKKK